METRDKIKKDFDEILEILHCILDVKHLTKEQEERVSELIDYHIEAVEEYNTEERIYILEEALDNLMKGKQSKIEQIDEIIKLINSDEMKWGSATKMECKACGASYGIGVVSCPCGSEVFEEYMCIDKRKILKKLEGPVVKTAT